MNRLQKISSKLAQGDRRRPTRLRGRAARPPLQGSWRSIIKKLARHPDRYLL